MLVWLYFGKEDYLRAISVPFISFCVLSAVRYFINRPRPYEKSVLIKPVNGKTTKGKSMPSRHTFSVFIIAFTAFCFSPVLGVCLFAAGVLLGTVRVLLGVHFISDVIVAATAAAAAGFVGFCIIPL